MLNVGVIGYGYWGPNLVRNFGLAEDSRVVRICDLNPANIERARRAYPHVVASQDPAELLTDPKIDVVAVATPVSTHYSLARAALENGKHIFIEKPFTQNAQQAEELIELGERRNLKIMVDFPFLYTPAVNKIKELLDEGVLGKLLYYDSTRINLGLFQHDVNVVWDLAPHDFSIIDYLASSRPLGLTAFGMDHFGRNLENIAYITVCYEGDLVAHFNTNWLSPLKIRLTLVGGDKRMLVWDDLDTDEKIKVYDKGVSITTQESMYGIMVDYRTGDMFAPKLERTEALTLETARFVDSIVNGQSFPNDGVTGLRIVRMLEACDRSMRENGRYVTL